jgi:hypothetical protein
MQKTITLLVVFKFKDTFSIAALHQQPKSGQGSSNPVVGQ